MKYGSKTTSDTLIEAETGLKTREPSRTATRSCRAICIEPSRGIACAVACHMAKAEHVTSYGERRVEARVALQFGSAATEGY